MRAAFARATHDNVYNSTIKLEFVEFSSAMHPYEALKSCLGTVDAMDLAEPAEPLPDWQIEKNGGKRT